MHIVFLDSGTLPDHLTIPRPLTKHQWTEFDLGPQAPSESILEASANADILITNKVPLERDLIDACGNLKHIAVAATGYNIIDLDACRKRRISVSNIPNYAHTTVAEYVLMCALSLRRNLFAYRHRVIQGAWQKSRHFCLYERPVHHVANTTVGIIGYGQLGRATANLMRAIGAEIIVHSRQHVEGVENVSLDHLLACADIVSVHCSLNESTRYLIGEKQLKLMKSDAILINTARGGIVDEWALRAAVEDNAIGGVAMDVMSTEPPTEKSALLSLADRDNVIITPHIAWASEPALRQLTSVLGQNIEGFIDGKPRNLV